MPGPPAPMLPSEGTLPHGSKWRFEYKWDGVRAIAQVDHERVRIYARSGADHTLTYPELAGLGGGSLDDTLLDGEIVVLDQNAQPSFSLLSRRFHTQDPARAAQHARTIPVTFMVFDLLRFGGDDLTGLPYVERRRRLEALELEDPHWTVPPSFEDGAATLASALEVGLEGVVAKQAASTYRSGRTQDWIKTKPITTADLVVGGWWGEKTRLRSLLVGEPGEGDSLRYRGRVGSGIGHTAQIELLALLTPLIRPTHPFDSIERSEAKDVVWAEPLLVVEVAYHHLTPAGHLRHPRYLRYRPDKTLERIDG